MGGERKGVITGIMGKLIDGSNINNIHLLEKDELCWSVVDYGTSLRRLMGLCHDFIKEEGMLQHIATCLGVEVLLTPKRHAEHAGEGVEYIWDGTKCECRRRSLARTRGKDNFKASVYHCLSEKVISIKRVRK